MFYVPGPESDITKSRKISELFMTYSEGAEVFASLWYYCFVSVDSWLGTFRNKIWVRYVKDQPFR